MRTIWQECHNFPGTPELYWGQDTIPSDKVTLVHKLCIILFYSSLIGAIYWSLINKSIKKNTCMHAQI